jgi:hypothetical protein
MCKSTRSWHPLMPLVVRYGVCGRGSSCGRGATGTAGLRTTMAGVVRRLILRDRVRHRYLFWATFFPGDEVPVRPVIVEFGIAGHGNGFYSRSEGDRVGTLLRYDNEAPRIYAGSHLDVRTGVWRGSEAPVRNVWLGSDYGEPITIAQAEEIIVELGFRPDLLTAETIRG